MQPMNADNSKKKERSERKKKKLLALSEVMTLNEADSAVPEQNGKEPETKKSKPNSTPDQLSDEQYKELKNELTQKRNHLRNIPKLRLKEVGDEALISTSPENRIPLLLDDIQHLLMHSLLRSDSPYTPNRWCVLEKNHKLTHTVVLLIEGLSLYDYTSNVSLFTKSGKLFNHILEIIIPSVKIFDELAGVPLTETHKDILIEEHGSLEAAMHLCRDYILVRKSIFMNIEDNESEVEEEVELPETDKYPRTQLLLSPIQMIKEDYPLPLHGNLKFRFSEYVLTNDTYKPATAKSPLFGLDCEMCKTTTGQNELARVSVCDENGKSIYETMVRPDNKIIDYLTQFSGITAQTMLNVTKTLKEVQQDLRNFFPPDAILVGQSLNFDLHSLKMMHPYVIDTSILFNITGHRTTKSKLKFLAKKFLDVDIQCSNTGHSSIEDSIASLNLVKLKLSKDIYFGDQVLQDRKQYNTGVNKTGIANIDAGGTTEETSEITTTIFSHASKKNKRTSIITTTSNKTDYHQYFSNSLKSMERDEKLISFKQVETQDDVIEATKSTCINYDFNLSCILLDKPQIEAPNIPETIQKVDAWIKQVWDSLSLNGMFVVILAGGELNPTNSGVAMLQTKKN